MTEVEFIYLFLGSSFGVLREVEGGLWRREHLMGRMGRSDFVGMNGVDVFFFPEG